MSGQQRHHKFSVGVARRVITPPPGVELAGLGYYLHRNWQRVRDDLCATAFVVSDTSGNSAAILALDLMYNDAAFSLAIRERIVAQTNIPFDAICVNCSHSHNAPTAGFIRGAGEQNPAYLNTAAQSAAEAAIEAWRSRRPAVLTVGQGELLGMTFNRTRENGPVDTRVSVLRADSLDDKPLAVLVNFHSHCTAHMEIDLAAVSRDWPGEVIDAIEKELVGVTALYLQGTCGDVNFRREFNGTEKRFEPAQALTRVVFQAMGNLRPVQPSGVSAVVQKVSLSTRRWTPQEITVDREEAIYRLHTGDLSGWLEGFAKVIVNQPARLPLRYGGDERKAVEAVCRFGIEWTEDTLRVLDSRCEGLDVEVQALRIGDVFFAANPSELFTTLGLDVRARWPHDDLFMLSYSNGSIGYLPDAYDVERRTYAAIQSPKFTGQYPFTDKSGAEMVSGLIAALNAIKAD